MPDLRRRFCLTSRSVTRSTPNRTPEEVITVVAEEDLRRSRVALRACHPGYCPCSPPPETWIFRDFFPFIGHGACPRGKCLCDPSQRAEAPPPRVVLALRFRGERSHAGPDSYRPPLLPHTPRSPQLPYRAFPMGALATTHRHRTAVEIRPPRLFWIPENYRGTPPFAPGRQLSGIGPNFSHARTSPQGSHGKHTFRHSSLRLSP